MHRRTGKVPSEKPGWGLQPVPGIGAEQGADVSDRSNNVDPLHHGCTNKEVTRDEAKHGHLFAHSTPSSVKGIQLACVAQVQHQFLNRDRSIS